MKRKDFIKKTTLSIMALPLTAESNRINGKKQEVSIRLLRHATLIVQIGGKKILIDPLFAPKEAYNAINTYGDNANKRNPLTNLPISQEELSNILSDIDAVMVTHTHSDHWDKEAVRLIDKSKKLFCQPEDLETMEKAGFKNISAIEKDIIWQEIKIFRTGGQHGTEEIAKEMAPVSGFVLEKGKHKIYIAGDTIWCSDVNDAISKHQPTHIIVNAGGAQFEKGDPITMNVADVVTTCKALSKGKVIAVHMDTYNHCHITRNILKAALEKQKLSQSVTIPLDGETILCN